MSLILHINKETKCRTYDYVDNGSMGRINHVGFKLEYSI